MPSATQPLWRTSVVTSMRDGVEGLAKEWRLSVQEGQQKKAEGHP